MQKDLKIGLALGMVLAITATLWLATHPRLNPRARMPHLHNAGSGSESPDLSPAPAIAKSPASDFRVTQPGNPPAKRPAVNLNSSPRTDDIETEQSVRRDWTAYEQTERIKTEKFHIVRKGQTLSEIAYEYYGSAGKWQKILDANRETIRSANKLAPGTKLIIPD